ncbi:hypothetical protein J7E25_11835 [Agromyces sp. ISL-38]|uniref:DUF6993 domain-containing protein n=1 Tax=Agromyces sp. ISL-38 TaxID=2819107 RepID=UPI001BEC753B|nr:hypothetical protein [Agromyces sp. ISL-38]MBT2499785.1 hypothetical protein [Agromyces sp. ISL-38]MBT2516066.1 hypothetical protein [Streptomyces sp. ISL-90]
MARRIRSAAALAFAGVAIIIGVAGCTGGAPDPTVPPTTTAAVPLSTDRPEPTSLPPSLRPELSASENLAYFDTVGIAVATANPAAGGRDFIDALVAAGFDKSQMQVTADRTTVDLQADSVQFSVLFQGECLVGQYGPKSGGYHGAVRPPLGTGTCLVGQTRPIDW